MKRKFALILCLLTTSLLFAAKVHIIGDSMSSIYGDQSNQASANKDYTDGMRGWGQFFGEYLTGMSVQDWAHTGTTAKGFYNSANYWKAVMGITDYNSTGYQTYLLERPYVTGYTAVAAGDYVIITFGHNDQKGGPSSVHNGYKTVTESEYLTYLTQMVNEVKAAGAYPILGTSICRSLWSGNTLTALGKIDAGEAAGDPGNAELNYPLQARQLAATLNIPCLDMNLGSRTIWEECGKSITGAVFFPAGGTTHTSEAGARAVCAWANNTIASWTQTNMNGAALANYQPLINAMKPGIRIPQKSDYAAQEAKVTEKTLWTFDQDLEGNAYSAGSVVTSTLLNYNGLYLRGFESKSRTFTTVANTDSITFSDAERTTVAPNFQITTTNVLGSGKETETSICPVTAGVAVSDGTSRCVAINTAGPGTFYIAMRSSSSAASGRVFNLAFNGEIKATAPTSSTITELKWHATTGGVFCAWATQGYNIVAVLYVPDADDSEDRLHEGGETPETPIKTRVPVIITAGQSNTDGRGTPATQPDYLRAAVGESGMSHVLWSYGNSTGWNYTGGLGQFAQFVPAAESSQGTSAGRWAYDAIVYYELAQHIAPAHDIYIIKESAGGSSISPSCTSSGDRHWSVEQAYLGTAGIVGLQQTASGQAGKALAPALIANARACIESLSAANKEADIRCILWHQGESDRSPSSAAAQYEANLRAVIGYIRDSLVAITGKAEYATLPFVMGTVSKHSSLYSATIEKAQYRLAETMTNVYVVDMQDGTMLSDVKHFDAASQELYGRRVYNQICDLGLLSDYGITAENRLPGVSVAQPSFDFGDQQVVSDTTLWDFSSYNTGDTIAKSLVCMNGLYLRGYTGNHAIVKNKNGAAYTNSSPPGFVSPTATAGMAVNSSTDRCFALNIAYPGTIIADVQPSNVSNATRRITLWMNGDTVVSKTLGEIDAENNGNRTTLQFTSPVAGVVYLTSDQAYYVYSIQYLSKPIPDGGDDVLGEETAIGAGGWSTLCLDYNYTIANATAYIASAVSEQSVELTPLPANTVIPAKKGVAVRATGATFTIYNATEKVSYDFSANLFFGTTTSTVQEDGYAYYGIVTQEGQTGFAKAASSLVLPAGKAFLKIENDPASPAPARMDILISNQPNTPIATGVVDGTSAKFTRQILCHHQIVILRDGKKYDMMGRSIK